MEKLGIINSHNNILFYDKLGLDSTSKARAVFRDAEIFRGFAEKREKSDKIQCGDFVKFKSGQISRVAAVHKNGTFQIELEGSFCIYKNCVAGFSGSLEIGCLSAQLEQTEEMKLGKCWIFSDNKVGAGRRIDGLALFPVWREV